jgi:hypothetical protein
MLSAKGLQWLQRRSPVVTARLVGSIVEKAEAKRAQYNTTKVKT